MSKEIVVDNSDIILAKTSGKVFLGDELYKFKRQT